MGTGALRVRLAAFALLAGLVFGVPVGSATQRCKPPGSKTLASDRYARAYGKGGKAFVCVRSTGKTTRLRGASPSSDKFALGGKWVAYSSGPAHSVVNVRHIPDHVVANGFPFDTGDRVDKVVVKHDGASAWAATPQPSGSGNTYVQGTDRRNHSPDQFSDDTKDVVGSSLRSLAGRAIGWRYTDGSSGSARLF
jgi:hypothetical protein